jgi:hypothetical protein
MSKQILVKSNEKDSTYFVDFLSVYYNIKNFDDCINWCKNNIILDIKTINRILDIVWQEIIKNDFFDNAESVDKLVLLYIFIYKEKYKKDIDYHIMDKVLRKDGKKLLNTKLIYNSNKSYQNEIKKSLYNNID